MASADLPQTTQDECNIRAEEAAVGVKLVDHDVAKIGEEMGPLLVEAEDSVVQLVGIGKDDVAATLPNQGLSLGGRVAVVLAAGDEGFIILHRIDMGGKPVQASIAIADAHLFIRTANSLFCVGN